MMEPEGRRGYSGSLLIPAAALVVLIVIIALVAVMCVGGDGGSEEAPPQATPTPEVTPTVATGSQQETALVAYVASQQKEYAGPCAETDVTEDAGKVCSIYGGEREGVHAFTLGLTFSESFEWAFVAMQGGAWSVVGTTSITPESAAVPGIPWPLSVGAKVVVIGTGSCLNVRTEPGGSAVDCITEGTEITLSAGPQEADDREWWRVEGRDGWVAADYLRYPDSTSDPEPTPTSAPAADGTPEATATP